jgi:uncharacterized membrane protein YphA (DoxX/SURF4 family)
MSEKTRNLVTWIVSGLLGALFVFAGASKLFVDPAAAAAQFEAFGLPPGMAILIGVSELAGGIALLVPRLAGLAAAGLTIIMLGAVYSHATHDPLPQTIPALVVGALCLYVVRVRRVLLPTLPPKAGA